MGTGGPAGGAPDLVSLDESEAFALLGGSLAAGPPALPATVCRGCSTLLGVDGAAVALLGRGRQEAVAASDAAVGEVEDWQFTFDEGPCITAYASGQVVRSGVDDASPWPRFAGKARSLGFAVLAGLPLRAGPRSWGSLDLYHRSADGLDEATMRDATVVAGVIARLLLARLPASPTAVDLSDARDRVHQASGMVSVQRGVTVGEAVNTLRRHAIEHDRQLGDVARDVVAGRLRFDR